MSKSLTGIGMGLLVGFIVTSTSGHVIRFVDDDAAPGGDGQSWRTAYHDLQDALDEARLPDSDITEIRLAGGIYKPDRGTGDKTMIFLPVNGVSIYGGFAGLSARPSHRRDLEAYRTIITGDLEGNDDPADPPFGDTFTDNSFQTLNAVDLDDVTILDGLVLSSNSSGPVNSFGIIRSELKWRNCRFEAPGGIFCFEAAPSFEDCVFSNDRSTTLFLRRSEVTLDRCIFRNNGRLGLSSGGAIRADENSTLAARDCKFIENGGLDVTFSIGHGGAIFCEETSSASFTDCEFISNVGGNGGGAIFMAASPLTIENCRFFNNRAKAGGGGAIYINEGGPLVASNSQFKGNTVDDKFGFRVPYSGGGAIGGSDVNFELTGCRFQENSTLIGNGGGVMLYGSQSGTNASIVECEFVGNKSMVMTFGEGGGLWIFHTDTTIRDSIFRDNFAELKGGGIRIISRRNSVSRKTDMSGCLIQGNQTLFAGGGLSVGTAADGPLTVSHCQFIDNEAGRNGGGFSSEESFNASLRFEASIFRGNTSGQDGGAISISRSNTLTLINCLLNDNASVNRGGAMHSDRFGQVNALNCTISGNNALTGGGFAMNGGNESFPTQTLFQNCIFWNNSDASGSTEEAQLVALTDFVVMDVNHCTIQGLTGSLGGVGNIGDDPLFVDADGADNVPATEDDDLHLSVGSTSIDSGDNDAVILADITTDLNGNERIFNDTVDRGAYEFNQTSCPADIAPPGGDGRVNILDLLFVLRGWDRGNGQRPFDVSDLLFILANWGDCPE
ncbi:MAG: hypothetical protein IIB54_14540 [Planctomycetes bacterium]|nr:hypothetical protein [Planctomycetota bacterium]